MTALIKYEYVVVGAGVVGATIAYHLARRGRKVLLLERATPASIGASAYPGGILRGFDLDPLMADIATQGLDYFLHWGSLGFFGSCPVRHLGFTYLLKPSSLSQAETIIAALGSRSSARLLPKAERAEKLGALNPDHGIAIFEHAGGVGDPAATARSFCAGMIRHGGTLLEYAQLHQISARDSGGWMVALDYGLIAAERIVLATGAWSKQLLPSLPLETRSISLACVQSSAKIDSPIFDEVGGVYIRPLNERMFYCGSTTVEGEVEGDEVRPNVSDQVYQHIFEQTKTLLHEGHELRLLHGVSGMDAYTSSRRPYLGFIDQEKTFYIATGFSGRGYKYALWAGDAVAADLCNQNHGLLGNRFNLDAFRLSPNEMRKHTEIGAMHARR